MTSLSLTHSVVFETSGSFNIVKDAACSVLGSSWQLSRLQAQSKRSITVPISPAEPELSCSMFRGNVYVGVASVVCPTSSTLFSSQ